MNYLETILDLVIELPALLLKWLVFFLLTIAIFMVVDVTFWLTNHGLWFSFSLLLATIIVPSVFYMAIRFTIFCYLSLIGLSELCSAIGLATVRSWVQNARPRPLSYEDSNSS